MERSTLVSIPNETIEAIKIIVDAHGGAFEGVQEAMAGARLPSAVFFYGESVKPIKIPFNPEKFSTHNFTKMVREEIEYQEGTPVAKKVAAEELPDVGAQTKLSLREKLAKVYETVTHIEKYGENTSQGYNYLRSVDVLHVIRKALAEQRIYAEVNFAFDGAPYTIARAKTPNAPFSAVNVRCSVVFFDLDSDETKTASGLGTGADTGDKAAYKAQTGALKYAIKNAFLVPDEADPEADPALDENPDDFSQERPEPLDEPVQTQQRAPEPPAADLEAAFGRPVASAPAPAPEPEPVPTREPGDEPPENNNFPTEEELAGYRAEFKQLGDDLSANGGLKASRGLPVNKKLIAFLLFITGVNDAKNITVGQWENFFDRVEKVKLNPEVGLQGLTKLVNKANGIEEK